MNKFYYLILLISVSCGVGSEKKTLQSTINLADNVGPIKLSSLIEIDSTLELQLDSNHTPFGEIVRILNIGNRFVLHTDIPSGIMLVNHNGKVITQKFTDYNLLSITSLDYYADNIYVLDRDDQSIKVFDRDLNFKSKIKIPFFCQSFKVLSPNKIVFYAGNETTDNSGKLIFYDTKNKNIISEFFPVNNKQRKYFNFLTRYHFIKSAELLFWDSALSNLFEVSSDTLNMTYMLDYSNSGVPKDFYLEADFENAYEFVSYMRQKNYAYRPFRILGNNNYLLISYEIGNEFVTAFHNFKTGNTINVSNIIDDIYLNSDIGEFELSFFGNLYNDNQFVSYLPSEFVNHSGDDNDILVFGHFKNF